MSGHSFVIETYGCQMNTADSGIMETLLRENGMVVSKDEATADVIIMNTCSVREHAEMIVLLCFILYHRFGIDSPSFVISTIKRRSIL